METEKTAWLILLMLQVHDDWRDPAVLREKLQSLFNAGNIDVSLAFLRDEGHLSAGAALTLTDAGRQWLQANKETVYALLVCEYPDESALVNQAYESI
ncbi:hypothetical protein ACWKWU_01490 [Chitinophaga lutea]